MNGREASIVGPEDPLTCVQAGGVPSLAELREAQRVHETFTELSIAEAGPEAILEAVRRLSGGAVVLESEQHQVLDYLSGPGSIAEFLDIRDSDRAPTTLPLHYSYGLSVVNSATLAPRRSHSNLAPISVCFDT